MPWTGAVRRARSSAVMCLLVLIRVAEYTPRVGIVKRLLVAASAAQDPGRQEQDRPQELEHRLHADPDDAERNGDQPDQRPQDQRQERQWPAEDKEKNPEEYTHGVTLPPRRPARQADSAPGDHHWAQSAAQGPQYAISTPSTHGGPLRTPPARPGPGGHSGQFGPGRARWVVAKWGNWATASFKASAVIGRAWLRRITCRSPGRLCKLSVKYSRHV